MFKRHCLLFGSWHHDNNLILSTLSTQGITHNRISPQMRNYCMQRDSQLTHVDETGKAKMVDVSNKDSSKREAIASASVIVGPHIAHLIKENNMTKGDVLSVAEIAGILGAKKTSEIIPLCHNITLTSINVQAVLNMDKYCVDITASVISCGKTGVEMEALAAVTIAGLTVYDMCKAVSHDITITDIRLSSKSGGKRNFKRKDV